VQRKQKARGTAMASLQEMAAPAKAVPSMTIKTTVVDNQATYAQEVVEAPYDKRSRAAEAVHEQEAAEALHDKNVIAAEGMPRLILGVVE